MSGCQKILLLTSWTNFLVVGENKKMILELESYQLEFEGVSDETWKPERLQGRTCDICARQNFLLVWNKMMPRFYSSLSVCLSVGCQRSRQHWPEGLKEIIVEIGSFTYTVQGRYNFQAGRDYNISVRSVILESWSWAAKPEKSPASTFNYVWSSLPSTSWDSLLPWFPDCFFNYLAF